MSGKKLSKAELAELAARAMNLLMHLRCLASLDGEGFENREDDEFHALANMLPEVEQPNFWNNATLRAKDLA